MVVKGPADYPYSLPISTRWMDNDVYGHVNNVTYYSYFDTAINHYLLDKQVLDFQHGEVVGFIASSECQYVQAIAFPDQLIAAVRVIKLGNSSVTYEVNLFRQAQLCAVGKMTHVFVNKSTGKSTPIIGALRKALAELICD